MKRLVVILFFCFITSLVAQSKTTPFSKYLDTISFKEKDLPVKQQKTYNSTAYELKKFRAFKSKVIRLEEKKYLNEIHAFTKDSLQILAVKLISIKELYNKNLLDKDIAQNKDFYTSILIDLRKSEINQNEYLFLENKLSKIKITEVETQYAFSKKINIFLIISLVSLLGFMVYSKRKKTQVVALSKQETTVKNLILKGKTNKEIAEELFISLSTVKTHITNIYQKLSISNRADLITAFKNTTSTST